MRKHLDICEDHYERKHEDGDHQHNNKDDVQFMTEVDHEEQPKAQEPNAFEASDEEEKKMFIDFPVKPVFLFLPTIQLVHFLILKATVNSNAGLENELEQ